MKSFDESPESITSNSLSFLSKTAIKFASSGIEGSIYQIIAEALRELNPNAIIVVNSIDSQQEISRTEAFITPPNMLERIISILGFKPVGKSYKIDSSILELESGYIRKFEQGLHELSFKTIPKSISKSLEQLVNLGAIYGIAFLVDGKMYANAAMILRKGDNLSDFETIETFVRQASITLKRVEAEKEVEKFHSLFEHMNQGAFYMRADGKMTDVNSVALDILGVEKLDFLYKKNIRENWDLIDENHNPIPTQEFPANIAISKGEPVYEKIVGVFNPIKNDYVWILINAIPQFTDDHKQPASVFVTFQDISTLRKSIHKVMDSEANARAIMESTDEVIVLLDPEGVVIDCNQAHAKRLNIERENLIGKSVFELLPKDIAHLRKQAIKDVIQSGKPICREDFRAGFWNEYTIHPIVSHRGKIDRVAVFSKDITSKKIADEQIKNNYSLLRIAGETAKFGGWIVDLEKSIVIWSDVVYKIHDVEPGFKPSLEKGISFYAPEWREKITEVFSNCVINGTPYDHEMEIITSKQRRLRIRTTGEAIRDQKGKIIKIQGSIQDISENKKISDELIASEREKSSLIDNLPGFVYKCANDRNWTMYYLSEKCFNISGYHPQDLINNNKLSYNDIIHPDFKELVWNRWQSALESGTSFQEEYKIITASNEIKWVWEQGSGIYSKDGKVTHLEGFIADITKRKEMEEALKESEANLAELNATKDKFFSIIAHDLKSPFNSIIGIGELLSEQIKKKEFDDLEEYASIMQDSSHKAMNLLTNLLEWSRSQTGRMDFNPEFIRISLLADEVIDLLLYSATQKSIRVISQIPKSAVCFADKAMISSVLRNLVSNAVKFTENGGEVIISAMSSDSKYIVTVSDNGTGMSKEESDNLFRIDKFYSTRGTNNEGGTGLGLILCKEFISRHGCEIWAESKKGKGSNFLFTLPRNSS